jgi:hypothetical protein
MVAKGIKFVILAQLAIVVRRTQAIIYNEFKTVNY